MSYPKRLRRQALTEPKTGVNERYWKDFDQLVQLGGNKLVLYL
jgi:hypothetical protein